MTASPAMKKNRRAAFGPLATPSGRLTAEGREFVERWLDEMPSGRRIGFFRRKFAALYAVARRRFEDDEIDAILCAGASTAALRFDPDRNIQFLTFASFAMRRAMENALGSRPDRYGVSICGEAPIGDGADGSTTITTLAAPPDDRGDAEQDRVVREAVRRALDEHIPAWRDRQVIALRFGLHDEEELTAGAVARVFGLRSADVLAIEQNALALLRGGLTALYFAKFGGTNG